MKSLLRYLTQSSTRSWPVGQRLVSDHGYRVFCHEIDVGGTCGMLEHDNVSGLTA